MQVLTDESVTRQKGVSRIMPPPLSLRGEFWRVARAFVARLGAVVERWGGLRGAASCACALLPVVPVGRASFVIFSLFDFSLFDFSLFDAPPETRGSERASGAAFSG